MVSQPHTKQTHTPQAQVAQTQQTSPDRMRERKSEGAGVVFALDQRSESTLRCIPRWTICASRPPTGYGPAQTDSAALRTRLAALCLGCMAVCLHLMACAVRQRDTMDTSHSVSSRCPDLNCPELATHLPI